eukprot:scaffold166951_cov27-Tisochrysis_lutea.AAC.1
MTMRSRLIHGSAAAGQGATAFIDPSATPSLSCYVPLLAGHWLPVTTCEVLREGCPYVGNTDGERELQRQCTDGRGICARNHTLPLQQDPYYCQSPTFVQVRGQPPSMRWTFWPP